MPLDQQLQPDAAEGFIQLGMDLVADAALDFKDIPQKRRGKNRFIREVDAEKPGRDAKETVHQALIGRVLQVNSE